MFWFQQERGPSFNKHLNFCVLKSCRLAEQETGRCFRAAIKEMAAQAHLSCRRVNCTTWPCVFALSCAYHLVRCNEMKYQDQSFEFQNTCWREGGKVGGGLWVGGNVL